MSLRIDVDISDGDRELRRLDDAPDLSTVMRLESLLTAQFQATQMAVHIITGSLRESGKIDSELGRAAWNGEIVYGGAAPGSVHDPVRYAQIEQQRGPGGSLYRSERGWLRGGDIEGNRNVLHDFMAPVHAFEHQYEDAMLAFLAGNR